MPQVKNEGSKNSKKIIGAPSKAYEDMIILAMSSVLEGGRSPSGDALRSYASRVGVNPKDGPSGGKVGDVEAEPTGNFVVVLTPLFPQSWDRASRRATEVKVSRLSQRPPKLGFIL
uniref:Uncharacterized protein n=1 Tax=Ananas comosus var. bracteatus TaxID=296719 RepID=A0A6V7PGB7_ANACO|nr:unnamed protein product [Ananas comosus var. bracteatus]